MNDAAFAPDGASRPQQSAKAALALLLTGLGVWTLHRYLPALIWAAILAIAIWPLYQRAVRRWPPGKHNILLPAVFTAALALVFIIPLVTVAVQAGKEVHGVFENIAEARNDGIPPPEWLGHLPIGSQQATNWWQENLATPDSATALLQKARESHFVAAGPELGADIAHRAVLFGFMLLTLFFLFKDGDRVTTQMQKASARAFGPAGERVGRQMVASVHGTVDGLVLVGLAEGFIMGIAYVIAGVPHPTLFGLFTAVAAMVPFGAAVAFGFAALFLLIQGSVSRHRHRCARHDRFIRRRSLLPPNPDRKNHTAAVPVGITWHPGRRRNLGPARPVPRPRNHGRPDAALARMGGAGCRRLASGPSHSGLMIKDKMRHQIPGRSHLPWSGMARRHIPQIPGGSP